MLCEGVYMRRQIGPDKMAVVECPTCGRYEITQALEIFLDEGDRRENAWILSGIARQASESGGPLARFDQKDVDERIASANPPRSLPDAVDRVMLYVVDHMKSFSRGIVFKETDWPLFLFRGRSDLAHTIQEIRNVGYGAGNSPLEVLPSTAGWAHAEKARRTTRNSRQAFVAMRFNDILRPAYDEGFKPALEENGYEALRVDDVQYNEKVDDRIIAEIRRSAIVVADFTEHRGGVYFEAGFGLGLGIPVIFCCRSDELPKAHFDTRQYNFVEWTTPLDLQRKLSNRIAATAPGPAMKQK